MVRIAISNSRLWLFQIALSPSAGLAVPLWSASGRQSLRLGGQQLWRDLLPGPTGRRPVQERSCRLGRVVMPVPWAAAHGSSPRGMAGLARQRSRDGSSRRVLPVPSQRSQAIASGEPMAAESVIAWDVRTPPICSKGEGSA